MLGDPRDPGVLSAQNHLLGAVSRGGIAVIDLLPEDYARIAELNERYADLPSDFDVYRRFRRGLGLPEALDGVQARPTFRRG